MNDLKPLKYIYIDSFYDVFMQFVKAENVNYTNLHELSMNEQKKEH